jgi:hypothetical protein
VISILSGIFKDQAQNKKTKQKQAYTVKSKNDKLLNQDEAISLFPLHKVTIMQN